MNIIAEDEKLNEVSMDDLKGGLAGEARLCCIANSSCNSNKEQPEEIQK